MSLLQHHGLGWGGNEFQEGGGASGKGSAYHWEDIQETQVQSQGWEDPVELEMATQSSILVWKFSWTEESGGLESVGSKESDMTE